MPLVTVIIPIYNAHKYLPRCLDSLLAQDFADWEAILMNDGSTDGSEAIMADYATRDSRLRCFSQPNAGPGAARNAALKVALGEYLQFVDADDYLPAGAIAALAAAMPGQDLAVAHFDLCTKGMCIRRGLVKDSRVAKGEEFLDLVIKWPGAYYYSAMWNKMYRRSVVIHNELHFDEGIIWGEDCLFNMQYYCFVNSAAYVPEVVYRYYRKVGGLSWGSVFQLHKGIRIKGKIYRALKHLYTKAGLFKKYRWRVHLYLLNITLMD